MLTLKDLKDLTACGVSIRSIIMTSGLNYARITKSMQRNSPELTKDESDVLIKALKPAYEILKKKIK